MLAEKKDLAPWQQAITAAEKHFTEIAKIDGDLVTYKKEAMFAWQAIKKSEFLLQCKADSIRDAVINVASVGLTLNPANAYAYLVPRGGVACLDISYKGLIKLASDSGNIKWAKAVLVYDKDEFEMHGIEKMPFHKFDPFKKDRGDLVGGYCAAKLVYDTYMIDTMTIEELDQVQMASKAANGPWKTWPDEMRKKSLIKRASKTWPNTSRLDKAVSLINEHEGLEQKYLDGTANQIDSTEEIDAEHILYLADTIKKWIDDDIEDEERVYELEKLMKDVTNDEWLRMVGMLKDKAPNSGPRGKMYSTLLKEYLDYTPTGDN